MSARSPSRPWRPAQNFDTNVQALVHVVDIASLTERQDLTVNLNQQIATETAPTDPASLDRLFGNELVAIDADQDCENFFLVSRGGNYVLKAQLGSDGKLDIGAPNVVRFQTGNIPTGIVVDEAGKLAFVNNQVNMSVSVLDLKATGPDNVIAQDVPSSTPPEPGQFDHTRLVGQLVFFTALGVPDNGLVGMPVREIVPLDFRGKQSNNAWSSCGSCHDEGLADGVTWIFGDGPRQTIPMDGLYSKVNGAHDTRINNWSAARDSVTDFNNNSRGVQGGVGFASDPPFSAAGPIPTSSITASRRVPARRWTSRPPGRRRSAPSMLPSPSTPRTWMPERPSSKRTARPATAAPSGPRARCSTSTTLGTPQAVRCRRRAPRSGRGVRSRPDNLVHRYHGRSESAACSWSRTSARSIRPIRSRSGRTALRRSARSASTCRPCSGSATTRPTSTTAWRRRSRRCSRSTSFRPAGPSPIWAGADALLDFVKAIDGRTAIFESDADAFHEPATDAPNNYPITR